MASGTVITGLGAICALGKDVEALGHALREGSSAIGDIGPKGAGTRISVGAVINDFDPGDYFESAALPLLDPFSCYAVIASREAVRDAGLSAEDTRQTAVIVGTGCGGKQTDEDTYTSLYKQGRSRAHPMTIPRGMPGAAASSVSMQLGIQGPTWSVTSACASAAHAVVQGDMLIRTGIADTVLVGGSDAPFTYGLLKAWEAMRVVSGDTCRPFSRDRSGMVLGEGAGMLVLESADHARARGARIYAELAGYGLSSDAGHITRPDIDSIARAIQAAIDHSGIPLETIDYINAHGTGTSANDPAETAAIRKVFSDQARNLSISSTKSMHAHALGASSALELIATVLAMRDAFVPPTANFTEAGEGCDLDYTPNSGHPREIRAALSNSFAFGGLNAVLALRLPRH